MANIQNLFKIINNKLIPKKYKLTIRIYLDVEKKEFQDYELYLDEQETKHQEEVLIPKHRLRELLSKEELDLSQYAWMEGIELRTNNFVKEIEEIASYGSLEAYQASLPENQDLYLLDLDCRIAQLELGI